MSNESNIEWEYDFVGDSLFINIVEDYCYKESVEITDNIILDLDEGNEPVALEILGASELFGLEKRFIKQLAKIEADIKITEEVIGINASFLFLVHQKSLPKPLNEQTMNDISLPVHETHFATSLTAK